MVFCEVYLCGLLLWKLICFVIVIVCGYSLRKTLGVNVFIVVNNSGVKVCIFEPVPDGFTLRVRFFSQLWTALNRKTAISYLGLTASQLKCEFFHNWVTLNWKSVFFVVGSDSSTPGMNIFTSGNNFDLGSLFWVGCIWRFHTRGFVLLLQLTVFRFAIYIINIIFFK